MLAHALKGKTPFEMKLKRKPNLANIHEFGSAAYIKDLKAGKLDLCVLAGHFVGYDIKSKGYRIYWPTKRTISVERNVVINDDDVISTDNITFDSGDILVEGERDQSTPKNPDTLDDLHTLEENGSQHKQEEEEVNDEPQPSNSIPFCQGTPFKTPPYHEVRRSRSCLLYSSTP